jgi:hypothetical protein
MWHEILHDKKLLPTSSTAYWLAFGRMEHPREKDREVVKHCTRQYQMCS